MTGIVLHRLHLGGGTERIGHPFCGAFVIGGEGNAYMAIVENGVVCAVSLLDLVEGLRDQEGFQAVARHEGESALEKIEPTERRELVEHHQHAMPSALGVKKIGREHV